MYDFMYVDPETISGEEIFPATETFVEKYKKIQLQYQSQNIGLDVVTHVQKIMNIFRNFLLPPPRVLLYLPNLCGIQVCVHRGPIQFSSVALPCCHPRNSSSDPVMKSF